MNVIERNNYVSDDIAPPHPVSTVLQIQYFFSVYLVSSLTCEC